MGMDEDNSAEWMPIFLPLFETSGQQRTTRLVRRDLHSNHECGQPLENIRGIEVSYSSVVKRWSIDQNDLSAVDCY